MPTQLSRRAFLVNSAVLATAATASGNLLGHTTDQLLVPAPSLSLGESVERIQQLVHGTHVTTRWQAPSLMLELDLANQDLWVQTAGQMQDRFGFSAFDNGMAQDSLAPSLGLDLLAEVQTNIQRLQYLTASGATASGA